MRSYRVEFTHVGMNPDTGKQGNTYLGSIVVDMKPNDPMPIATKAFRQSAPNQQIANRTRIIDLGPCGDKKQFKPNIEKLAAGLSEATKEMIDNEIIKRGLQDQIAIGVDKSKGKDFTAVVVGVKDKDGKLEVKAVQISPERQAHLDELKEELQYRRIHDQPSKLASAVAERKEKDWQPKFENLTKKGGGERRRVAGGPVTQKK